MYLLQAQYKHEVSSKPTFKTSPSLHQIFGTHRICALAAIDAHSGAAILYEALVCPRLYDVTGKSVRDDCRDAVAVIGLCHVDTLVVIAAAAAATTATKGQRDHPTRLGCRSLAA